MNLVAQNFIQERLKLSRNQCWMIIGQCRKGGLVPDQRVIDILNAHAFNMKKITFIPDNLLTIKEACAAIVLNYQPIARRRLVQWINTPALKVPHYKLNSHLIRIPADLLEKWAEETFAG